LWRRGVDFASFFAACALRLAFWMRGFDTVIAMTSPPLISAVAALRTRLRREKLILWLLDLNPDEAVAAGTLRRDAKATRVLEALLRFSLHQADEAVVMDRFMAERIRECGVGSDAGKARVTVLPPWSHDDAVHYDEERRRAFRQLHGLEGRFVVMYSGNHSPCHPLRTLLEAAEALAADPRIVFCFIGGGSEFGAVRTSAESRRLPNVVCLPYQPLSELSGSLSAADLHVAVLGDGFTGAVHPCKVYNIIALGIPFLYIGPAESHIADLAANHSADWVLSARHGDFEAVVAHIRMAIETGFTRSGAELRSAIPYSQRILMPRLAALVESAEAGRATASPNRANAMRHWPASHD
jgi:hypothetical protein